MFGIIPISIILFFISQYMIVGNIHVFPKKKGYTFYNILSVFCLLSFFNMFLWQYEINCLIVATFLYILSIAMYYVHEFRGTNLNFSDIASINTAKEVAGGYSYKIKPSFVVALLLLIFEYVFCIVYCNINLFRYYKEIFDYISKSDFASCFSIIFGRVILFVVSFLILKSKISREKFDYSLSAGENEGYIYNFVSSIPVFHRNFNRTNGNVSLYTKYHNDAFIKESAPHVIVIMNESFGSIHERVKTDFTVTPFYDSLTGVTKGKLYVNTFGGGTANTEFEFLTGMTVGNYPYPVMPYNNFVKSEKYTLATYFRGLGYETLGMHPYTATNYHRNIVYKYFGFEKISFDKDMENKSYIRNFVSDESMYQEVIEKFEDCRNRGKKLFLFGVTVQNHSGYEDLKENLVHTDDKNKSLDAYMSLMKMSDDALKYLIEYFEKEKEHVIVLFFGDHNASFGTEINKKYYDTFENYELSNAYSTPFLIYDNKKKENDYIENISANFLSIELLKKANLPLDDFHILLNEAYSKYSVYNFHKAFDKNNKTIVDIPRDKYMEYEKEYLKK